MLHAKPLLLVDDQKPQIFELQIVSKNPVSPHNDIHQSALRILHGLLLLCRRPESAHEIHSHGKILHTLKECVIVLLRQYRSRHKIHYLLILLHGFERRPDRDLCLPISYVSADQAVHDLLTLHIPLDRFYGKQLVLCLLEGKHLLEFFLPDRIFSVDITFLLLPRGI